MADKGTRADAKPLSARRVETLSEPGLYGDLGNPNLFLKVAPRPRAGVTKSWVFRYSLPAPEKGQDKRRRHAIGLGRYPDITLEEARDAAREQRRLRIGGIDPMAEKRAKAAEKKVAAAKTMTFRQCAEAYIAAHEASWKSRVHAKQWSSSLRDYVYPVFGGLPVQAIDTGLVLRAVEPLWSTKPETASRVRGRIESVLDWAKTREYRTGENPARWKGHLENSLPKKTKVRAVEHLAALPYADLAAFMVELRGQAGNAARALEFAILTAARTSEVLGATWGEIDLEGRQWRVPASRMKAGKEHRVPLSGTALALLQALPQGEAGALVFPVPNPTLLSTLKRMKRGDLTAHGFRSSFSDWAIEQTAFPSEVREMALAHAVGNKVEQAYRRGDLFEKRRQLAEAWARFCCGQDGGENIVPIRAAAG